VRRASSEQPIYRGGILPEPGGRRFRPGWRYAMYRRHKTLSDSTGGSTSRPCSFLMT
jgi:hypothetical protein